MSQAKLNQAKYLYCIIRHKGRKSFGNMGIRNNSEVHTIHYGDISAVVSDSPFEECAPNAENVLAHEKVVQQVMQEYTVLPSRFSTIVRDEQGVKLTLMRLYPEFTRELAKLEGKVELGVKALWDPKAAIKEVENTSPEIVRLRKEISSATPGVAPLLSKKLEQLVRNELNRRADETSTKIYNILKGRTDHSKMNPPVGHMILNAAFLVRRSHIEKFTQDVIAQRKQYEVRGVELVLTGPWPPYNFVNINYS